METGLVLQNEHWSWHFTTAHGELSVSVQGTTLTLPVPADDLMLCAVASHAITALEFLPESGARVNWGDGAVVLTLQLEGDALRWQLANPQAAQVSFPYWAALYTQSSDHLTVLTDRSFLDANGLPIFRHNDQPLPAVCIAPDETTLTLLLDHKLSFDELAHGITTAAGGTFVFHSGGWRAAFALLRTALRAQVDLSEYQREDLAWYQNQWVQHFTFLYGREILNLQTHQFELDRFLDESQRDFGGYDGILLWGGYPRLGIDERTQWDFFDDLPGGRAGLRHLVDAAHARGVRVFVPYKPWDQSAQLHGSEPVAAPVALAHLIHAINADGVFLDTMAALDPAFRASIDAVRPGVVLCSELRVKPEAFEMITGSWDQSYTRDGKQGNWTAEIERLPGADLRRFVFPEHRMFVINRHAVGDDRLRVTMRGFFGGTGWVVWQDIFGLVLPYTPEEAALLKKCRTIFQTHELALNSGTPTPLLPTRVAGVYCNEFAADEKRVWTFYNENDRVVDASIIQVDSRPNTHFIDCWNNAVLTVTDGWLSVRLEPHSVGAVVELPVLMHYAPSSHSIEFARTFIDAQLKVTQGAGDWTAPGAEDSIALPALSALGGQVIVQLVHGTEVLDQLIWTPE